MIKLHYKIRDAQHLTQEYMAEQLGISLKAYNEMETGKTDIRSTRLEAIAKILKTSPEEIYGQNDNFVQHNNFHEKEASAVMVQHGLSEQERSLYEKLIVSKEEIIKAKDETIRSMQQQMELLQNK